MTKFITDLKTNSNVLFPVAAAAAPPSSSQNCNVAAVAVAVAVASTIKEAMLPHSKRHDKSRLLERERYGQQKANSNGRLQKK